MQVEHGFNLPRICATEVDVIEVNEVGERIDGRSAIDIGGCKRVYINFII